MTAYISVFPTAVDVSKVEQAQSLQRAVAVLQSDLHGLLEEERRFKALTTHEGAIL